MSRAKNMTSLFEKMNNEILYATISVLFLLFTGVIVMQMLSFELLHFGISTMRLSKALFFRRIMEQLFYRKALT